MAALTVAKGRKRVIGSIDKDGKKANRLGDLDGLGEGLGEQPPICTGALKALINGKLADMEMVAHDSKIASWGLSPVSST